jgi:hypothetical protein
MRQEHVVFSAVQLLFILALFLIGGFFVSMEYLPHLKYQFSVALVHQSFNYLILGFVLVGVALLLGTLFYQMQKKPYFHVQMDGVSAIIEPKLIESLIEGYWRELFPEQEVHFEVIVREHERIEVLAQMPQMVLDRQPKFLMQIEKELGALLHSHLKYRHPLRMTITLK